MAGHASRTCSANLRHTTNRLRIVFVDRRPDFVFRDVKTMTHGPTGVGVVLIFDESLRVTEVHGEHSTERVTGLESEVEVEIQSQLSHILAVISAKVNGQIDVFWRSTVRQNNLGRFRADQAGAFSMRFDASAA
jgi:hypothetical protein